MNAELENFENLFNSINDFKLKKNKEENILSVPDDESKARYLFDIILNQQFNGNNIVEYIGNSNTAGPAINTYYNTKEFLNSGGFENVFITVNGYLF